MLWNLDYRKASSVVWSKGGHNCGLNARKSIAWVFMCKELLRAQLRHGARKRNKLGVNVVWYI